MNIIVVRGVYRSLMGDMMQSPKAPERYADYWAVGWWNPKRPWRFSRVLATTTNRKAAEAAKRLLTGTLTPP